MFCHSYLILGSLRAGGHISLTSLCTVQNQDFTRCSVDQMNEYIYLVEIEGDTLKAKMEQSKAR